MDMMENMKMDTNWTGNISCQYSDWYDTIGNRASFIIYYIVAPIHFVISILGHSLCFISFRRQAKKYRAYVYQIFLTISETLKTFFVCLYIVTVEWGANPRNTGGFPWPTYRSCYLCMAFAAYFPILLANIFITLSQLLTFCMSADRFLALWKPFSYKSMNHRKIHIVVAIFCTIVATSTNLFHFYRFSVQSIDNNISTIFYRNIANVKFESSIWGKFLSQLQSGIEAIGLFALYFVNVALLRLYRNRRRDFTKRTPAMEAKLTTYEKNRQETEKTLALLTISQSFCVTVATTCKTLFYTTVFIFPDFYTCGCRLLAPLVVASRQAMDICDIIFTFIISKHLRNVTLRCCKKNIPEDSSDRSFNEQRKFLLGM